MLIEYWSPGPRCKGEDYEDFTLYMLLLGPLLHFSMQTGHSNSSLRQHTGGELASLARSNLLRSTHKGPWKHTMLYDFLVLLLLAHVNDTRDIRLAHLQLRVELISHATRKKHAWSVANAVALPQASEEHGRIRRSLKLVLPVLSPPTSCGVPNFLATVSAASHEIVPEDAYINQHCP